MKTLTEHEAEFWENYQPIPKYSKCGVACPKCKRELYVNNFLTYTSSPPMREVKCCTDGCDYRGFIH